MLPPTTELQQVFLAALIFADSTFSSTNIATFSDPHCKDSYRNLAGPNGYPNGTCTQLQAMGNYSSFQVVNMDPGCTVTIYGPDSTYYPCSATVLEFADLAKCYNTSWKYYSIDSCSDPSLLSLSSTMSSLTSTSSTGIGNSRSSDSATENTSAAQQSQPVSTSTIAGITIGGVAGIIIVLGSVVFLFRRWRKRHAEVTSQPALAASSPVEEKDGSMPLQEMYSDSSWEMAAPHGRSEVPGVVSELPGNEGQHGQEKKGFQ